VKQQDFDMSAMCCDTVLPFLAKCCEIFCHLPLTLSSLTIQNI